MNLAVGVIKRTTARSAAALLHYPERRKFSWIAQKNTRSISNTHLTPFAEASYAMRLTPALLREFVEKIVIHDI